MAYDLQLQLNLQLDPSNVTSLRKQIESGLSGIDVKGLNTKNFAKVNAQINNTGKLLDQGSKKAKTFFDRVEGKARGFAAYTIASTAILKLTNTITQATREAIKFETELIKISQVTGDSIRLTKNYSNELVNISKQYNVNITKVAQLTRTLTQTGLSFREAAKGAEILARTDLLATFESLTSTTEGLIAVMQTFSFSVQRAGKVLESINAVSKQFAVESSDIVEAIRRTGGAFSTAGGQIEELIALFTAVRSTSRESAETIATGFRTIFGRLQRPKTIEFFKQLGIELETAEGKFIGPYEAILAISEGLRELNIEAGSTRFAQVVEQIGGIRQISRVVPLLQQVSKSQQALSIANNASIESLKDVEKAQQGLGFQLGSLQKEFGALINDIVGSSSFKFLAETFINIAKAVLRLTSALKPLMPFLATMAAFKIGRGLSKLLSGGFSLKGMKGAMGFASGGMVPGTGDRDTVPAMLTPGEFVIRKSAVKAIGADRLAGINKYAQGGMVTLNELTKRQGKSTIKSSFNEERQGEDSVYADLNRKQRKFDPEDPIWEKVVQETDRIYKDRGEKGKPFSAQGKAFENIIKKAIGNTDNLPDDYPIDIIDNGNPIEVKFTKKLTSDKDLVSKLYRHKFLQNQLSNLSGWTKNPTDEVDLGKLTVEEMGEGEKKKFNSWYGKRVSQGLNIGGIVQKFEEGGEAKTATPERIAFELTKQINALKYYTGEGSAIINSILDGTKKEEDYDDMLPGKSVAELSSLLDKLMKKVRPPKELYKGLSQKLRGIVDSSLRINELESLLPEDLETLKGKQFSMGGGYVSTSSSYSAADNFADRDYGGIISIRTKQEADAIDVLKTLEENGYSPNSLQKAEKEFILPRNSKFKVDNAKASDSQKMLRLNVQQFAKGGSVGTDTVPALLTPGEFVVNKKSAQAFGYGNLQNINKYAQGGVVDGMPVQYFKKGGKTAKAERTLSKEQRKALKEAALAKADADAGGTGLTRGGAREAEVEIGDLNKKTFKEIGEKWDKFVAEEVKRSKELYQAKISQMAEDGATAKELSDVIKEYQGTVSDIKKQAGVSKKLDMKTAGESNTKAVVEEISQREAANLAKVLEKPAKQIEKSTKTLSQKIKDGGMSVYSSLENLGISYTEAAFQAQAIVSGLKNFANLDVNQEALTQATVKGGVLSGSADAINQFADPKVIKQFGSNLNQVGKLLPKSLGGPVRKFGGMLLKNAGTIGKFAGGLAKGLNVLGYLELAGGVLDSLFSVDYGKQRDNLIALGDAAGAAEAAARAYSQEQYRAIPLIGGFLSAFGAGSGATEEDLDATGKLVVANSRLEASINGVDREVNKAKVAFQEAQQIGNVEGQQNALADQISAIDKLQENAATSLERTQSLQASGASTYGSGSAMMKGAGAGALGGAAIGAAVGSFVPVVGTLIGGLVGGAVGAIAGGAAAWASSSKLAKEQIIQGYELQGEAAKKAAEIQVGMIEGLTASLQAEAVRLAKNGGTYQDAVKNITDKFGEENVSAILDGRKLGEDPEADIKALAEDSQARDRNIMQLKQEAALLKDSETEKRAQIQAQIDVEEAELSKVNALKSGLVQTQAAIEREKKLAERRAIESAAMEYQIKLLKQMEKAYDGFNAAARDLADISEEIDNIGTGRLTTRQAAERSGYSDPRVYEMDSSEIVRNRDVAMDIAADIGGARGQEITMGQQRLGTISQLSGLDMRSIYDNARDEQTRETSAKQIQDSIYEKLGITQGADPVLDESIRRYAETIAEKGIVAAGQAENEAREKATETSRQIIEQQQAKMKELFEAEKKLRDMQIELVKRQMETAQKVYDAEKDYFDKRFALATKVEDVLNPIQERGPGRAAAIARRGEQRRAVQMDALQSRRSRQFGSIGLGGQSLDQAVNNVEAGLNNVGQAAGDQAEAFERLKGQSEALLNTIQDEISIEEERLDSLIESAKAQQEYTQSLYDAQGDIVRDLVTGTDEEVGNQLATMNAAAMAAQQGSFVGIPEDMKKDIFGLFDQFGDVVIPGLGVTGRDAQREITKNEMMRRFGVDEGTATQLASKAVKDRVPIDERMAQQIEEQSRRLKALYDYEARIKMAQLKAEQDANKKFEEAVDRFAAAVAKMREELQKGGQKEEGPDPQTPEGRQAAMEGRQQQQKDQMNQQQADNRKKADQEVDRATQTREKADREYEAAKQNEAPFKNAYDAQNARYNDARARRDRYAVGSEEYKQAQQEVESIDPERQAAYQQYEAAQERTRQARIRATNARVNQQESQGRRTALETREREQNLAMQRRQEEEARMRAASPTGEAGSELFANDDSDPFGPGPQAPRQRPTANTDQGVTPPRNNNAPQAPSQPQNPTDNPADTSRLPTDATAQQGPIQVNTQGQQDITIRLPDIQGVVNQQISEMVYSAVSEKFSSLANNVRSANNFDDVANALQGEATSTQTRTA